MFQKSLQILVASALLALAATVGYSFLRLHGPEDTLAEARARLAAGAYGEVIADLDLAERGASFARSPALLRELWRLRYAAYTRLDNAQGALADVQQLLANGAGDDEELRLDEIRLLAAAGDGARAKRRGRELLEDQPDHGRALELTGEACQTIYQPLLRELQVRLERELGRSRRHEARKSLLAYLYRPDGDPEIARAMTRLEDMYSTEPRLVAAWPEVRDGARALRDLVQEGLGFFQRSLDLGGEPVAAFRAVATAYEQSGRVDDLLMACEIQRRMFEHAYVGESGVRSAWAQLQSDLPRGALATVDRWIRTEEVEPQAAAGLLTGATEELALARALAMFQLQERSELWATQKLVTALREAGLEARGAARLTNAVRLMTVKEQMDPVKSEELLALLIGPRLLIPAPLNHPDLAAELNPAMVDSMMARNAPEADVLTALERWCLGRPDAVEPQLRTARYLQLLGRPAAALAVLRDAVEVSPDDPRILPLRVELSREHYANTGESGISLLNRCVENRSAVPDIEDPVGFLLCAETALSQPGALAARIAMNCARAAIGAFPRANLPRQLELRALIAQERFEEAATTADLTIRAVLPDEETLRLAIQAKRLADQPLRTFVRLALPRSQESPALQQELVRLALEDAPTTAVGFVTPPMTAPDAALIARMLAARAFAAAGRVPAALELLEAAAPVEGDDDGALVHEAYAAWLEAASSELEDDALKAAALSLRGALALGAAPQRSLLAALPLLTESHPKTAFALLERALATARPDERSGGLYALAGDLALATGDRTRAGSRWLAALGFDGGAVVAERLARLLVLEGEADRAKQVYALVTEPRDPALAARMGLFAEAAAIAAVQLQQDPADLLLHATLATFGQVSMVDWLAPADPEEQQERLELLSGLQERHLARLTLPRAEALLRRDPSKQTHYLLLARASADAGLAAAAAAVHAELFAAGFQNPVLYREVAYAGADPTYVPEPGLDRRLREACAAGGIGGSKLTFAYGAQRLVAGFRAGGFPEMARDTRLSQWLATPQLRPWDDDDLALITTAATPKDACFVLSQILRGPYAGDRERLLRAFYELAPRAAAATPDAASTLRAMALGHLQSDGARGDVVHFLLRHQQGGLPVNPTEIMLGHLERVARGEEDTAQLRATTDRLIGRLGVVETIARVAELVDRFPTSTPMWALHTELTTRLYGGDAALEGMRNVLRHAHDPTAELSFFGLAAAEREVTAKDVARMRALPEDLRSSPEGRYVQALFALRSGDAESACGHFEAAARQDDGRHLFLWAMAELMRGEGPDTERAVELLEQLLRDYPNSSLARNAGSFVRQLSPR